MFSILLGFFFMGSVVADSFEANLREELLKTRKYDAFIVPTTFNKNVTTYIDFRMIQDIQVDPHRNTFASTITVVQQWSDNSLSWKPENYGKIDTLTFPPELLWKPNVTLLNGVNRGSSEIQGATNIVLHFNGVLSYVVVADYAAYCPMDVKMFPYDSHSCSFVVGSWVHTGNHVKLFPSPRGSNMVLSAIKSSEWEVTSQSMKRIMHKLSCCPETYDAIMFTVQVHRRSVFYAISIMLPTFMSVLLTLSLLWIPATTPKKLVLSSFNVLILLLILVHVCIIVPFNGGSIPNIVSFCSVSLLLSALSLILSMITLCLAKPSSPSSNRPAPAWLKNLLNSCPINLCCLHKDSQMISTSEDLSLKHLDQDWIMIATLLDRLFFILYCGFYIIIIPAIFC